MLKIVLLLVVAGNSLAEDNIALDASITGPQISLDRLVWSPNYTDIVVNAQFNSHLIRLGWLLTETPARSNTLLRINYGYNWRLTKFLANESSVGLGYLESGPFAPNPHNLMTEETLIGAQNFLLVEMGKNSRLGVGGAAVKDLLDHENRWDNLNLKAFGQTAFPMPLAEKWLLEINAASRIYDPNRYWFVDRRKQFSFKTGPQFSGKRWRWNLFGGQEMETLNNEPFRKNLVLGTAFNFSVSEISSIGIKLSVSRDNVNQIDNGLTSLTWQNDTKSFEIFGTVRDGKSWQKESLIGLRLNLTAVGGKKKESRPMFSPEDYQNLLKSSEFHINSGYQDDLSFNLYEQADRLNSLRLRNEWSGQNLHYYTAGLPVQMPIDVYSSRTGDCDDQALLNAWIDRRNGYRSYLLSYWPTNLQVAHAVEIVQDPRTGRWFMDEYGVLQEIQVDRNASIETVTWEALRQGAKFSALPIANPDVFYWVDEPTNNPSQIRPTIDYIWRHDFQSTAGSRPRLERGFELFVGPDALWR